MKNFILLSLSLLQITISFSQSELYIPKEIKKVYEKKTRSMDGKPGEAYFQNSADYNIKAEFDPANYFLNGEEIITYYNNSPDDLDRLIIRLYQDIFKKGNPRAYKLNENDIHDGVNVYDLKINGEYVKMDEQVDQYATNMYIDLNNPLMSGKKLTIDLKWDFKFPKETHIRYGSYGSSFMIAYWFPRIAVYDDVEGWNGHLHNLEQEFYNDFGNFDVEITLPNDYLVWASGLLKNPEEVYLSDFLKKYQTALKSSVIINMISEDDYRSNGIFTQRVNEKNTWKYSSTNITDFAFAISKNYLWDAMSLEVDPNSGKRVLVNAVYDIESEDFYEVAEIGRDAITMLSGRITGTPYPYPTMTVFNGHGGMEFPMMVNDGSAQNRNGAVFVTAHEIAHTYFPFLVGSNEQRYAFIDEGLVTFLPKEIEKKLSDDKKYSPYAKMVRNYEYFAGTFTDVPMSIPSNNITGSSYRFQAYSRPAIAYMLLRDYLGEDLFYQGIQDFIFNWKEKHPTPYDFFNTFNRVSGEDLNWFWASWFLDIGYPDLELASVQEEKDQYYILIENKGKLPVPVLVTVAFEDGSNSVIKKDISIWNNSNQLYIYLPNSKKIKNVSLGNEFIPDAYRENNIINM